jgi:hypothetical protein
MIRNLKCIKPIFRAVKILPKLLEGKEINKDQFNLTIKEFNDENWRYRLNNKGFF